MVHYTHSDPLWDRLLAIYQQLLATLEEYQAEGIPVDPDLLAFAMRMVQTAGVNDGVIAVNAVGAPSDDTDGLVGCLNNLGNIVIQSVEAPFGAADAILNDATGGLWDQYVAPGVEAAWQEGVTMAYSLVVNGQAGLSAQTGSSWFVQQVVAPFVAAAVNRIAGIPQGVLQVGYLIHDASVMTAAAVYNITSAPGTPAWQPVLVSDYAAGLAQAQANGNGQAYAINAVLNAGTFGLYGDVQSFGPALQQSLATGDWTALSAWAGGTLVDAASNPLAEGVLDELGTTAAEASQSGALGRFLSDESGAVDLEVLGLVPQGDGESAAETLAADGAPIVGDGVPPVPTPATVSETWSSEATAETQLGQADMGTQAAATANAEAGLTEAINSAEATTEATAKTGDTADASALAEAQVNVAKVEAAAAETGAPAEQTAAAETLEEATAEELIPRQAEVETTQNGSVTIEPDALDYAARSPAELTKLNKLMLTADQLANQGFNVRILGENPAQAGDLAIQGPGIPEEVPAQSKRLDAGTQNAVKNNLSDGTNQAGDGGYTIIDGSGVGLTAETFEAGYQQFLRNSVANRTITGVPGKSGTVIAILGDGTILIQTFP